MGRLTTEYLLLKKDLIAHLRELHELDPLGGDTKIQTLMNLVKENIQTITHLT